MKISKTRIIFFFRWFIPSLIAFTFLFLPDLVGEKSTNPLAANWLARGFFVIYLINPSLGVAKVLEDKKVLEKEHKEYSFYVSDKDTLSITTHLATIFTFLVQSVVSFLGIKIFFPNSSPLIYVFPSLYTSLVGIIALYGLRLKKEKI